MATLTDLRLRRSVLYMPGSNPRALEKAKSLPADSLILDLEDAVALSAKPAAREAVRAALARPREGRASRPSLTSPTRTPAAALDR